MIMSSDQSRPWVTRLLDRQLIPTVRIFRTTKESTTATRLCAICAKHNFRKLFALAHDPLPPTEWETRYSTAHAQAHRETCAFCRLLCSLADALKPHDGVSNIRKTINVVRVYNDTFSIAGKARKMYVPCLQVDSQERIQMIYQPEDSPRQLLKDRIFRARVLKSSFDVDLLQDWLSLCRKEHVECWKTRTQESMEYDIRLIDVDKNCVVKVTDPVEYVALSYVWGSPEVPQLKLVKSTAHRILTEGGLSSSCGDVPSTILDAMEVCRRLGNKYLWVDALCIEQDNRDDQAQQIAQMHKIYSHAHLTIVAGYGNIDFDNDTKGSSRGKSGVASSWIGLPGVHNIRDGPRPQHLEVVQGLQLASLGWYFSGEMNTSSWNSRAWTFQEMQFSKRLLFFTQHQMFYRCEESLWREDQYLETDTTLHFDSLDTLDSTQADPERRCFKQRISGTGVDSLRRYEELAAGISRRFLTNQNDILASFTGIENALKETMRCDFVWGLPTAYFDYAQLFRSAARLPTFRRNGFPSWSWTGWIGPEIATARIQRGSEIIYYHDDDSYHLYSEIEWYKFGGDGYLKIPNTEVCHAHDFRQLDAVRLLWRPLHAMSPPQSIPALSDRDLDQLLVFQTSSAFVQVEAGISAAAGGLYDALFSADGTLRTINLRRNAPSFIQHHVAPDTKTVAVEFIVVGTIAAGPDILVDHVAEDNKTGAEGYLSLMAIETAENGVSQRIGIVDGKVDVQEWLKYRPQWRTVFLL